MDKFEDKNSEGRADHTAEGSTNHLPDQSRRRFSRGALVGSAVLLSLGNRAAWGQGGQVVDCMSIMTLNSFHPETGMFTSAPGGRPDHKLDLAKDIHEIGSPPDYLGKDGRRRTCEHPTDADRVCLVVNGPCPD